MARFVQYVVQWVIEKGAPEDRSLVVNNVFGQVLVLAQQKFASNVVEKCVLHGSDEDRYRLIEEVLGTALDGSSVIKSMLVHPYANYVMQSEFTIIAAVTPELIKCPLHLSTEILHIVVQPQRERIYAETALQLAQLRKFSTSYSKHLITSE